MIGSELGYAGSEHVANSTSSETGVKQTPQWLPRPEELALIEPVMTVMEADKSDEYLKTV